MVVSTMQWKRDAAQMLGEWKRLTTIVCFSVLSTHFLGSECLILRQRGRDMNWMYFVIACACTLLLWGGGHSGSLTILDRSCTAVGELSTIACTWLLFLVY